MATAVAASNDVMEEYDPDNDPLFGRLVSLRVDEPGHSWRDGIVAHVHTEVVDGIERATGVYICLLYTSPSPRDQRGSRMPSSA